MNDDNQQIKENQYQNIPDELKKIPQWVCVKVYPSIDKKSGEVITKKNGKIKLGKLPKNPKNNQNAKINDHLTWGTYSEALEGCKKYGYQNIGFAITEKDPYFGIDVDDCIDENGNFNAIAQEILNRFSSTYSEYSTSKDGVHFLLKGKLPEDGRKDDKLNLEFYGAKRFLVCTGDVINNNPLCELQEDLNSMYQSYFKRKERTTERPKVTPLSLSDSELLDKIRASTTGADFSALYDHRDLSQHKDNHSNADFALCKTLAFWTQGNFNQIDRLFTSSALYREDKWNRQDYKESTINKAINSCKNFYDPEFKNTSKNKFRRASVIEKGTATMQVQQEFQAEPEFKKINLIGQDEPCAKFTPDHLPEILREYILRIGETTDAHPIMITNSVFSTISAFFQQTMYMPKGNYFQKLHPNTWILNILQSGGFKSTAQESGCHIARERSGQILDALSETDKKNEKLLISTSIQNPILPNKITPEALLEMLAQGHSGLIITSEFGGWLQNMESNHNSDLKAIFTELYDVPLAFRHKTKNNGDAILRSPCFSINGVSTIDWVKDNIKSSDVSSGFFPRFLIYTPPPLPTDYIPNALPKKRENTEQFLKAQNDFRRKIHERDNQICEYGLSKNAENEFNKAHNELYKIVRGYGEHCEKILDPYLKRWSPYILKFAMLIRYFEDPNSKELSDTSINGAMSLLVPAINSTAKLFQNELGESDYQRKCRKVYEWVCKRFERDGKAIWKELVTSKVLDGGSMMYESVVKTLVEGGKIKEVQQPLKKDWFYLIDNK